VLKLIEHFSTVQPLIAHGEGKSKLLLVFNICMNLHTITAAERFSTLVTNMTYLVYIDITYRMFNMSVLVPFQTSCILGDKWALVTGEGGNNFLNLFLVQPQKTSPLSEIKTR
jgi:hypothetical protein